MRLTGAGRSASAESGSVLFLFPVALVVVLLLGAVAVDLGNVWLQQRRLADAADSAANDAVTFGLDIDAFRADGELVLDPDRVDTAVAESVAGQAIAGELSISVDVGTAGDGSPVVTVRLESRTDMIFGRLLAPQGIEIAATGSAIADDGVP